MYRKRHLIVLSWQFQAAFYGYDEGTQSNDMVLAATVWRRFFGFKCEEAEKVERIVKYIRVQVLQFSFIDCFPLERTTAGIDSTSILFSSCNI